MLRGLCLGHGDREAGWRMSALRGELRGLPRRPCSASPRQTATGLPSWYPITSVCAVERLPEPATRHPSARIDTGNTCTRRHNTSTCCCCLSLSRANAVGQGVSRNCPIGTQSTWSSIPTPAPSPTPNAHSHRLQTQHPQHSATKTCRPLSPYRHPSLRPPHHPSPSSRTSVSGSCSTPPTRAVSARPLSCAAADSGGCGRG